MWTRKPINIIILLIVFLLSSSASALAKGNRARINWKRVPGATGYEVIVKNSSNRVIIKTRTRSNFIVRRLAPGKYRIKIVALNKLYKRASASKWFTLTIKKAFKPLITSIEITEDRDNSRVIIVRGKNFLKASSIKIKKKSTGIPYKNLKIKNKDLLTFEVHNIQEGEYEVEVRNPGDRKAYKSFMLNFKDSKKYPVAKLSSTNKENKINGTKVKETTETEADNEKIQKRATTEVSSNNKENEKGLRRSSGKAVEYRIVNETNYFYISGAYGYHHITSKWNSILDDSYINMNLKWGYRFNNFFGINMEGSYIKYSGKNLSSGLKSELTIYSGGIGFFFAHNMGNFTPTLFLTSGFTSSSLDSVDSQSSRSSSSGDYYINSGVSLQYLFSRSIYLEPEFSLLKVFYKEQSLDSMNFNIRLGYRF